MKKKSRKFAKISIHKFPGLVSKVWFQKPKVYYNFYVIELLLWCSDNCFITSCKHIEYEYWRAEWTIYLFTFISCRKSKNWDTSNQQQIILPFFHGWCLYFTFNDAIIYLLSEIYLIKCIKHMGNTFYRLCFYLQLPLGWKWNVKKQLTANKPLVYNIYVVKPVIASC